MINLVLTDEIMQVSDIAHRAPLERSGHSVIIFKFHCYLDNTKPKGRYSYEKADYQGTRNDLTETNWADEFLMAECGNNVEDLWTSFKSKIYELRNKFVPKTTVTGNPWWNKKGSIPVGKPIQVVMPHKMPAIDDGCLQRREQMSAIDDGCLQRREQMSAIDDGCLQRREQMSAIDDGCLQGREQMPAIDDGCLQRREQMTANDDGYLQRREQMSAIDDGWLQRSEQMFAIDDGCLQRREQMTAIEDGCLQGREQISAIDDRCLQRRE